ncbi:hypothetical protein KUV57_10475 [Epibacterium sp. DP7N7-1]|nr:hypothetical protein [Epibacterium sp. DP7N7-1]
MFYVGERSRANYYKYLAKLNFEAADAADMTVGFWPGYESAAPPPVMTLCAHSIELSLKAFLLDHGDDEKRVRKLSHNLIECLDRCVELGADADSIDRDILVIISDLLVSGRLRYGEESELGRVPVYGPLSELCRKCLDMCGAPKLADILG